jgi:hypothetical protein
LPKGAITSVVPGNIHKNIQLIKIFTAGVVKECNIREKKKERKGERKIGIRNYKRWR